jgi:Tfp pilus assembly protein PilF
MSKKTSKKKTQSLKDAAKRDFEEGMFYFNKRDMDNALQFFLKAVEKDPNYKKLGRGSWQYQFRQDFKKV